MRVFFSVAIDLTEPIEAVLRRLEGLSRGIKVVRADKLHLTLKFLGEVKAEFVPRLQQALVEVAQRHRAFEIELADMGVFPHARQPRVIWMGIKPQPSLLALVDDLELSCQGPGFEKAKERFAAHVTLARCQRHQAREVSVFLEEHRHTTFAVQDIDAVRLTQSHLEMHPTRYSTLAEAKLRHGTD